EPECDVLLAGVVFCDIVFTGLPRPPEPGVEVWTAGMGSSPGGIANLAVACARLGLATSLAAVFSDDGYGQWCWDILARQEDVDLTHSRVAPQWHSPVTVSLAYGGDRALVTHAHAPPVAEADLLTGANGARAIVGTLDPGSPRPWWTRFARCGAWLFADVGWDPSGQWDRGVLDRLGDCYCFTPNVTEAMAYTRTDTAADAARALGQYVPLAVVTRGQDGVTAFDAVRGELVEVAGMSVAAIDPTGAGDVFTAALIAATLGEWPLRAGLRFATLAAALSVQQFGGALAAPGWGDIDDWWRGVKSRAAAGDALAARYAMDYAFLADVLPTGHAPVVRRAEATIARLSDVNDIVRHTKTSSTAKKEERKKKRYP
ncbi:MAG: PfkB family carbohydrate kinase, partial [Bifidobacteriaceae bacterium]|nr:PfkB family carbohydrate kinase [Bifidobacteriaceae bacterium]